MFDAAKQGDELAAEIVDRHGKCLGKALAQIACVVDPEVFVIGGGVSKAGTIITDTTENISRSMHSTHARTRSSHLQHLEMMPVCMVEPVRL